MQVKTKTPTLYDLPAGTAFSGEGLGQSFLLAIGKSEDGKRQAVNLQSGIVITLSANMSVTPYPHAELTLYSFKAGL
ncbi:hypothetical protein [Cupriavidus basilensis]|uniref:hypothetical protein n=1 Tax=Cupriavidus basilensis TaxID=68895 RepID=UPI0020A64FC6|nr:hypothetical protein [Cupriavidus basilensis]MCP3017471.1 hypothetical protein [Cupriavidus basilensis]